MASLQIGRTFKNAQNYEERNPLLKKQDNQEPYKPMNKSEYLDLKVKLEDVHMLRREVTIAIEDQKRFSETGYAEKNGRTRLREDTENEALGATTEIVPVYLCLD